MSHLSITLNPHLKTPDVFLWNDNGGDTLVAHSLMALYLRLFGETHWHDDRSNCATWTDAAECRCDSEGA